MAVDMNSDSYSSSIVGAYSDENVSRKVVRLIQSYTGIVNKMIWRK
jgi:UDP-N-acetylglucosamine 2-epimerase (non-hydrolysing)